MIDPHERVSGVLHEAWPEVVVGAPVLLSGGFWAAMYRVPIQRQPPGVANEVVVRFAPHREMGAKESEVQRAVGEQGFPTPAVWHSAPDAETGGWWSVMEYVAGQSLVAGLDGPTVLRRAPTLLRELPVQLAQTMAALHQVDPAPVAAAVKAAAPEVSWSITELLDRFRDGAAELGRIDLVAALDRLAIDAPPATIAVVCHGDFHPFNVLDRDGELVVVDWTGAIESDPCFDVAFTDVLLSNPPLGLPGPIAPLGTWVGRRLARRFVDAYALANPSASLANLGWFRAVHSARILLEVAVLVAAHGPDAGGHPFATVAPAAAGLLADATGVDVTSR